MTSWYWSLRGLDLLLATLGILAGVASAVAGAVAFLAREISRSTAHNQATCDCPDCRRRRAVASRKRWAELDRKQSRGERLSTNELHPGMIIVEKGQRYRVTEIAPIDGAWHIRFVNLRTRALTEMYVKYEHGNIRRWERG